MTAAASEKHALPTLFVGVDVHSLVVCRTRNAATDGAARASIDSNDDFVRTGSRSTQRGDVEFICITNAQVVQYLRLGCNNESALCTVTEPNAHQPVVFKKSQNLRCGRNPRTQDVPELTVKTSNARPTPLPNLPSRPGDVGVFHTG